MSLTKVGMRWFFFSILTAIVSFAGMVFFSRFLGASILGIYFLFLSVLTIFNLFTNMGLYPATIKRISEGKQKSEIAAASLLLRLGVFAVGALIILIFHNRLNLYIGSNLSYFLIFILGLTQFSDLIREILHGEQKVDIGGAYDLIQQFLRVFSQSFLILVGFEIFGLIMGLGIGILISLLVGLKLVGIGFKTPRKSHFESLLAYSKFSFGSAIGGYLYEWVEILIIGVFLTQKYVGVYGIAWGLSAIFLLLSNAVGNSIYPKISELSARNEKSGIVDIFSEGLIYSPLLAIPAFFGTLIVSENLLGAVYGQEFKTGYIVLIILMLARVFQSMQIISVRTLEGMNLPNLVFKVNVATTILNIFGALPLIYLFGFIGAGIGTLLTILVSFIWNTNTICRALKVRVPLQEITLEIVSATIMGAMILGISTFMELNTMGNLIAIVLAGAAIYFAILLTISKRIKSKCLLIIKEVTHKNPRMVET